MVGFSVSKKVGNSVTRNLVKRRLREIVRPMLVCLKPGLYVVVVREAAAKADFSTLRSGLLGLMKRQHALREGCEAQARTNRGGGGEPGGKGERRQ